MTERRQTERYESVPIFNHLDETEIARILMVTEEMTVPAGKRIFAAGDPCDGFYILLEGRVEIRKPDGQGGEVRIAVLQHRSVFGEMALVVDRKRASSAVAVEECRLNRVLKKDFDALLGRGDLAAYKVVHSFAKVIAERLKKTEEELLALLRELGGDKRERKLAELQEFRQKLFTEWSF